MPHILETTVQISSSSNPKQSSIIVNWDQEIQTNNGEIEIKRKGYKKDYSGGNGCLLLEFGKDDNTQTDTGTYAIGNFPLLSISTDTTHVHTNPNSLVVIASSGDITAALDGIKNQLLSFDGIDQSKVRSMTGQSAFIYVFDTKHGKWFFETAPATCHMVIDINAWGVPNRKMSFTDYEHLLNRLNSIQLSNQTSNSNQAIVDLRAAVAKTESRIIALSMEGNSCRYNGGSNESVGYVFMKKVFIPSSSISQIEFKAWISDGPHYFVIKVEYVNPSGVRSVLVENLRYDKCIELNPHCHTPKTFQVTVPNPTLDSCVEIFMAQCDNNGTIAPPQSQFLNIANVKFL